MIGQAAKAEVATLKAEVAEQKKKSSVWVSRVSQLTTEAASAKEALSEAQTAARAEAAKNEAQLASRGAELARMQSAKEGATRAAERAAAGVAALRAEVAEQKKKSNVWLQRMSASSSTLSAMKRQLADAEAATAAQARSQQERIDAAKADLARMEASKMSACAAADRLRVELVTMEQEVKEHKAKSALWLRCEPPSSHIKGSLGRGGGGGCGMRQRNDAGFNDTLDPLLAACISLKLAGETITQRGSLVLCLSECAVFVSYALDETGVATGQSSAGSFAHLYLPFWLKLPFLDPLPHRHVSSLTEQARSAQELLTQTRSTFQEEARVTQDKLRRALEQLARVEAEKAAISDTLRRTQREVAALQGEVASQRAKGNLWVAKVSQLTAEAARLKQELQAKVSMHLGNLVGPPQGVPDTLVRNASLPQSHCQRLMYLSASARCYLLWVLKGGGVSIRDRACGLMVCVNMSAVAATEDTPATG